ncbi:hypothetical protein Gotri_000982 [Gossypium trilobum]|uniref:Uncharacterized protein n=1 Tax=Gossypium trilobum TaxID=34281 RepID=A0A7J9FDI0_9ROSI|nr:hypothetical protein [Gossypium trilobum]
MCCVGKFHLIKCFLLELVPQGL